MIEIIHGDALAELPRLEPESIDAVAADPPAGIKFMGRAWDADKGGRDHWIAWLAGIFVEARRTLRPGALVAVWALPRTSHWTMAALERSGFEILDVAYHVFSGNAMPKSMNVEKALRKAGELDAAETWAGWGTGLKPGCEFWILARKPGAGDARALGPPRIFYVAKASTADRGGKENQHPTVKPTSLMSRVLGMLRELSPAPLRRVLDMFGGSGTTAVVCQREGLSCVIIEQGADSVATIRRRVEAERDELAERRGRGRGQGELLQGADAA